MSRAHAMLRSLFLYSIPPNTLLVLSSANQSQQTHSGLLLLIEFLTLKNLRPNGVFFSTAQYRLSMRLFETISHTRATRSYQWHTNRRSANQMSHSEKTSMSASLHNNWRCILKLSRKNCIPTVF